MTSQEINQTLTACIAAAERGDKASENHMPLWEIAYQLAKMNEMNDAPKLKSNPFGERFIPLDTDNGKRCPCCGKYYDDTLADPQPAKRDADSKRGETAQNLLISELLWQVGKIISGDFSEMSPEQRYACVIGILPKLSQGAQPADPASASGPQTKKDPA